MALAEGDLDRARVLCEEAAAAPDDVAGALDAALAYLAPATRAVEPR